MSDGSDSTIRNSSGKFVAGNPGGPGRPRTPLSANAIALDQLGVEVAQDLMKVLVDQARGGNLKALDMVMSRIWPVRRGRAVAIGAPEIVEFADYLPAQAAVTDAVLSGQVTPQEGAAVVQVLEADRVVRQAVDMHERLAALEEKYGGE